MKTGFIGTGVITSAIVTGLCTSENPPERLWVSPRNKEKASQLASRYDAVQVAASNQEVLDHADLVVLAVLPRDKEVILGPLAFRNDHTVIHLLAGTPIEAIQPLVAPAEDIVRAVPLTCTAIRQGPIALFPGNEIVELFFSPLGSVIVPDHEAQLETLSIVTSLMAPFYAMTEQVTAWTAANGIQRKKAAAYTAAMFGALAAIAEKTPEGDIPALVAECMTPGGLNELAMETIGNEGGFGSLTAALEKVKQKIS